MILTFLKMKNTNPVMGAKFIFKYIYYIHFSWAVLALNFAKSAKKNNFWKNHKSKKKCRTSSWLQIR